jgi:hypothetical protein
MNRCILRAGSILSNRADGAFTLAESALLNKLLHSIQPCLIGYAVIHPEAAALETGFSMNGAM